LFLTRAYKNNIESIERTLCLIKKWKQTPDVSTEEKESELEPIFVYGSGGSPMNSDAYACDITKNKASTGSLMVAHPQNTRHAQNATMMQLTERRGCVAVFLSVNVLKKLNPDLVADIVDIDTEEASSSAVFLGYYYFASFSYGDYFCDDRMGKGLDTETAKNRTSADKEHRRLSRFKEEQYFRFVLAPMFPTRLMHEKIDYFNKCSIYAEYAIDPKSQNSIIVQRSIRTVSKTLTEQDADKADPSNSAFIDAFFCQHVTAKTDDHNLLTDDSTCGLVSFTRKSKTVAQLRAAEILVHCCALMSCGALRYMRHNIIATSNRRLKALPLPPSTLLPTIYRCHSMPMPVRSYDVSTLLLRGCAIKLSILNVNGEESECRSRDLVTEEIFFMAMLNRFTGRPAVFHAYREHTSLSRLPLFPLPKEIVEFLQFADDLDCHAKLFSGQHINAIPTDLRRHFHVFSGFILELAQTCGNILTGMLQSSNRRSGITYLTTALTNLLDKHKTHLYERNCGPKKMAFISHQVVSDLEEIYCDPFGDVTLESLVPGMGALEGLKVCGLSPKQDRLDALKRTCTAICGELSKDDTCSNNLRSALGLSMCPEKKILFVLLNKRQFGIVDVEHMLCKVYIGIAKTLPGRSNTKRPHTSKPWLHPLREMLVSWDNERVEKIMDGITEAHEKLSTAGYYDSLPQHFYIEGEIMVGSLINQ
jgi:hypothetical protein